jgi:AraC family transcriptional regulator
LPETRRDRAIARTLIEAHDFSMVRSQEGSSLPKGTYFGTVVRHCDSVGLRLTEVSVPAGERLPMHAHEPAFFCLVLAGAHKERFGSAERIDRPFSATRRPSGFEHHVAIGPDGERFFTVELSPDWLRSLEDLDSRADFAPAEIQNVRAFSALLQLHREFCRARDVDQGVDGFTVESLTAELIGHSIALRMPDERRRPPWLARVTEYLEAHATHSLRVGPLADQAGVHPVHLARVFRQVHRCSMAEYQTAARIRRACALLGESELTLAQIALWTGFTDQSHFTRAFTAMVGWPPGAFRRTVYPDRQWALQSAG